MSDFPALKDRINTKLVTLIADRIKTIYPDFASGDFISSVDSELHDLELKPRFKLIADNFKQFLPEDYPTAVQILVDVVHGDDNPIHALEDVDFNLLSIPTFIEQYGTAHFDASMQSMYIITRYTTCEFAIRPFITQYPDQAMDLLKHWRHDDNEHVRRLVSEGTRPRLPWAPQLKQFIADPTPTIELLQPLKDDPSLYVRRSVANHLNDITKDHPETVMDTLEAWQNSASDGTLWLINHALRTLVKKGDQRALKLLGYGSVDIELQDFTVSPEKLIFGDSLTLQFSLKNLSDKPQNLMVDYIMHFVKANGKTSPKVFKLKKTEIGAGETVDIEKSHSIRPISTRKYYAGTQHIEIQVNGSVVGKSSFELIMPD